MKATAILCALLILHKLAGGQSQSPQLLPLPQKYAQPIDSVDLAPSTSVDLARRWVVYSDRNNNQTYTSPTGAQPFKVLNFMEEFYVIGEQEEFLHVAKDPSPVFSDVYRLSDKGQDFGWIPKNALLLWKHCLVTKIGQISKKVMVLNTIDALREGKGEPDVVEFRVEPRENAKKSGSSSALFQFFFMLKRDGDWVLLAKNDRISDLASDLERREVVVGWAPKSRLTFWDHRKAIEPNWMPEAAKERREGYKAAILIDEPAARSYGEGRKVASSKIFWDEDSFDKRNIGEWRRFPILETPRYNQYNRLYVGAMGSIYLSQAQASEFKDTIGAVDVAVVNRKIDNIIAAKRQINVMFVVDGTTSMGPYFEATRNALRKCMTALKVLHSNDRIQFGVAIYRDYLEKERLFEVRPLQGGIDELISFLDPNQAKDYFDNDEPEALFYGLKKALYTAGFKRNETNILVLVGDAGNHHRQDPTQVDPAEVISMLSSLDCHLLAFQVHYKRDPAYGEFVQQAQDIVVKAGAEVDRQLRDAYGLGKVALELSTPKTTGNDFVLEGGAYVGEVHGLSSVGQELDPQLLTDRVAQAIVKIGQRNDQIISGLKKMMDGAAMPIVEKVESDGSSNKYTSSFAPGMLEYLRQAGIRLEELQFLKKKKYQLYQPGWAAVRTRGQSQPLFKFVLFLSKAEFSRLVNMLEDLQNSKNTREDLQNAWKDLLKKYLGNISEQDLSERSLQDLSDMVFGLPSMNNFLANVNVADITDPTRFPDSELNRYINDIEKKYIDLRRIFNMNTTDYPYAFRSNEEVYYWLEEDLLP